MREFIDRCVSLLFDCRKEVKDWRVEVDNNVIQMVDRVDVCVSIPA